MNGDKDIGGVRMAPGPPPLGPRRHHRRRLGAGAGGRPGRVVAARPGPPGRDQHPTVYAYFDSKNAIYDAMFGQAATQFADRMAKPYECADPRDQLVASVRRFAEYCTGDLARYQLLFQRTLPGFEPSPQSTPRRCAPWTAPGTCWRATGSPRRGTWTCGPRWSPGWSTSRSPTTPEASAGPA